MLELAPDFARRVRDAKREARFAGEAMDRFVQMNAGTISPAEFFSQENVGAIMAAARVAS